MSWSDKECKEFVNDRNTAFVNAVLHDDWDGIADYLEKYNMRGVNRARKRVPVVKAAIYKAVQECTDISDEVKSIAAEKCLSLGFSPFILSSDLSSFICREDQQ